MTMPDGEIVSLIARARTARRPALALRKLEQARQQVMTNRPNDPIIAQLFEAIVDLSELEGPREEYLKNLKGRAEWTETALGPSHVEAIQAWYDLGDAADEDCDWPTATGAWERIAAADLPADAPLQVKRLVSQALRRLGARRLSSDPRATRAVFERELRLREALDGPDHPDIATSLANLATVCEALGDTEHALAVRTRQLEIIEATFGLDHGGAATLRTRIVDLRRGLNATGSAGEVEEGEPPHSS